VPREMEYIQSFKLCLLQSWQSIIMEI